MKRLLGRLAKLGAEVAASKATHHAAQKVANTVGPHRALGKVGLLFYLVGTLIIAGAWFFLAGGWFWLATILGALAIGIGYSLRSVNDLIVGFLVRIISSMIARVRKGVEARMKRTPTPATSLNAGSSPASGSTSPANGPDKKGTN